jgi:hypothetical protein
LTPGGGGAWTRPRAAAREPTLTRYGAGQAGEARAVVNAVVRFTGYEITAGKDLSVPPFTGHPVPAAHVERQLRHLREFLR